MSNKVYNVLFLCTGNSARSIMGEAILNRLGAPRFRGYSAGSHPKAEVNPRTIVLLRKLGFNVSEFRSKSWDEFAKPGAPQFDFIITVCDDAAKETCPIWTSHPLTAHWGIPDPAAVKGSESEIGVAFADAYGRLERRIKLFLSLPLASLDKMSLQSRIRDIGKTADLEKSP